MDRQLDQAARPEGRQHRQRLAPEERRGAILDAALTVFADVGYAQATLNDVAERVGVTKGCLYHYFESKEQLLIELIRERISASVQLGTEAAVAEASHQDALRALLERIWQRFQEPGQIEVAILAITELPNVPEGARFLFEEVVARSRHTLRQELKRGTACDISAEEIERAARVIPFMILGVAMGMRLFRSIDPTQFSSDQVGQTVTNLLLSGLTGVCPNGVMPGPHSA
jgi:AcrR family transcriptional regulator